MKAKWLFVLPAIGLLNPCFLTSCGSEKKTEHGDVVGETNNIEGSSTDKTQKEWSAVFSQKNFTDKAKWYVVDNAYALNFTFSKEKDKISFSWQNLSSGCHTFQLGATYEENGEVIRFTSDIIYLNIYANVVANGGNTNIVGDAAGKDTKGWMAIYENVDYSSTANWVIQPAIPGISIDYDPTVGGAIVKWENLKPGAYNFIVVGNFVSTKQKKISAESSLICLNVKRHIECSGGTTEIHALPDGVDDQGWKAVVDGEDYSSVAAWEIEPENKKLSVAYNKEKKGAVVSWNGLEQGTALSFKVKCNFYAKGVYISGSSPLINLSVSEKKAELIGGSEGLAGYLTGSDSKAWQFLLDGKNITSESKWKVIHISGTNTPTLIYDYTKLFGLVVHWDNFAIGDYQFMIECVYENVVVRSPVISLRVMEEKNLVGGSPFIHGFSLRGRDINGWRAVYKGEDYTSSARWTFSGSSGKYPIPNEITLEREDDGGYHVHWHDMVSWGHVNFNLVVAVEFAGSDGKQVKVHENVVLSLTPDSTKLDMLGGKYHISTNKPVDETKDDKWVVNYMGANVEPRIKSEYVRFKSITITYIDSPSPDTKIDLNFFYDYSIFGYRLAWNITSWADTQKTLVFYITVKFIFREKPDAPVEEIQCVTPGWVKFDFIK